MPKEEFTYAKAGVDRKLRAESKKALEILKETYSLSRYGEVLQLPYGNIFPFRRDCYLDIVVEGVGTKVLLAQLADKYDTIGIDGVAMAVNDVIRSGARPLAVADNIHAQASNPRLVREWLKGIAKGAEEAECIVAGGEIGDVSELIKGLAEGIGFDMVVAAIGEVPKDKVVTGRGIKPGDSIVGLRSSGIHSNGVTLARKVLFKRWGGKYDAHDIPEPLDRELVYEVLEPTRIYVKSFHNVAERVEVKGAVHITGDAYLKFERLALFSRGVGFEFNNFKPQPIFSLIQKTAMELGGGISDEEMFKTFNMGWGFAIIVEKADRDMAIDALEKAGVPAEEIGQVTDSAGIKILHKGRKIVLG
ncbi:MAG: phosphoribosylformylglycinamidine cyclo-ligase [Nitrososphaerota archaeon]|nr:phosphoribosylformylglycinamidine cyclo-ligase [Candidatus Bathyarchaeota archaeon]MDW8024108.1 phosphoribosylformylglycinamidine cyclo-ligase [Nitrososphaerota archaeon]